VRHILLLATSLSLIAQPPDSKPDPFKPFQFLLGDWVGEGSGAPGAGSGDFSLQYDLQRHVLVRKSYAEYPASQNRPAYRHDDLMIVYMDEGAKPPKAIYFDSEGHVISYSVVSSENSVRFVSGAAAGQPRYRLTYRKTGDDTVALEFEIAPPGKPDAFASYIQASARRKGPK